MSSATNSKSDSKNKDSGSKKTFKSGKAAKRRAWQENAARETTAASSIPRR